MVETGRKKNRRGQHAAYAAWPDRLYVVGVDGKIAYQGGPGPGGFRVNEVEAWLKVNTKAK